jgi:hypothetical protein
MSSFLFIADVPPNKAFPGSGEPEHSQEWRSFLQEAAHSTATSKDAKRIGESTWLLPASGAWPVLESLASAAAAQSIPYSVLLVEGAITELTSS